MKPCCLNEIFTFEINKQLLKAKSDLHISYRKYKGYELIKYKIL